MGAFLWVQTLESEQTVTRHMAIVDDSGYPPTPSDVMEALIIVYGEEARGDIEVLQNSDLTYTITTQGNPNQEPIYLDPKSYFSAAFTVEHVF